jgi:predicted ABC-type ATPase
MNKKPALWIISGPNGVGKTTYAKTYIKKVTGSDIFINQDEIARGISPLRDAVGEDLVTAARISIAQREKMLKADKSFTIETTLSGRSYLNFIKTAKARGYKINLLYFFVNSIEESLRRIQRRVEQGGHHVSEADVRRRFPRSALNFYHYASACDHWTVFDNNDYAPQIVVDFSDTLPTIRQPGLLQQAPQELQDSITKLLANSQGTDA